MANKNSEGVLDFKKSGIGGRKAAVLNQNKVASATWLLVRK